jgi:hypothetical protein
MWLLWYTEPCRPCAFLDWGGGQTHMFFGNSSRSPHTAEGDEWNSRQNWHNYIADVTDRVILFAKECLCYVSFEDVGESFLPSQVAHGSPHGRPSLSYFPHQAGDSLNLTSLRASSAAYGAPTFCVTCWAWRETVKGTNTVSIPAGWSVVRVPTGSGNFSLHHRVVPALGPTQYPIQWAPGTHFLVIMRAWREADHSPPPSAEIKNAWSYTSTPQYAFMAWC